MSGKRMIHESLFSHTEINDLPIEARYLFIAIIIHTDDHGRMRADPKYLKLKSFPFDDLVVDKVRTWRDQLATKGLITVYEINGKEYLFHPKWSKWQTLRKDRMKPTDCPDPCQPIDNQMSTIGCQVAAEVKVSEVKISKLRQEKLKLSQDPDKTPKPTAFASLTSKSTPNTHPLDLKSHAKKCTCEECWEKS